MANLKQENVKRFIEDISKNVADKAYEGGGTGGVASYQLISDTEALNSKSYRIDWSKLPDFIQNVFGINPDLTLGELANSGGGSDAEDFLLIFPLAASDESYSATNSAFGNVLHFAISLSSGVAHIVSEGYLNGFLDFNVTCSYSNTLREAIALLPETTRASSSGLYELLILGAITVTEISE